MEQKQTSTLFPASKDLPNQPRLSFPSRLLSYYMECTLPCRRDIQIQDINNQDIKKTFQLVFYSSNIWKLPTTQTSSVALNTMVSRVEAPWISAAVLLTDCRGEGVENHRRPSTASEHPRVHTKQKSLLPASLGLTLSKWHLSPENICSGHEP